MPWVSNQADTSDLSDNCSTISRCRYAVTEENPQMIFVGVRAVQAAWTVGGLREKLREREEYPEEATTILLRLSGREECQAGVNSKMLMIYQSRLSSGKLFGFRKCPKWWTS